MFNTTSSSLRRVGLSNLRAKKTFASFAAPNSARNFSIAVNKRENKSCSRVSDNFRVSVSLKNINSRQFSVSIVKFQDVSGLVSSTESTAISEPTESSQDILPEVKDPNLLASTTTSEPALEESSTEIILDFLPEKPEIKDPTLLTSTTTSEPTLEASSTEIVLDFLPEKPTSLASESIHSIGESMKYIGDPPFDTLGLNSLWPPGRAQWLMEHIHIDLDMPWWSTILIMTCIIRTITLKFVIMSQKNSAIMANAMPETQMWQQKVTDARKRGDMYDAARYTMEMTKFQKESGINPLKSMAPIFVQFPFFMGMFFGLRAMAYLPVESMCNGGLAWFKDLSVADPYYILPVIMCSTIALQFKLGADGMATHQMGPLVKKGVIFGIPPLMFLFTKDFPAAVTLYWCMTNIISVAQARILRLDKVREKLGIPKLIKHTKDKLPEESKGFRQTVKDSIENFKMQRQMVDRRTFDEDQFKQAGEAPVRKTYKFDPTKRKKIAGSK